MVEVTDLETERLVLQTILRNGSLARFQFVMRTGIYEDGRLDRALNYLEERGVVKVERDVEDRAFDSYRAVIK